MNILSKKLLEISDKTRIIEIWNKVYPSKLNYTNMGEFDAYLAKLLNPNHFVVSDEENMIQGWACKFTRENQLWFAILVDGKFQGKKIGSHLLNELKKGEAELNGWVADSGNQPKNDGSHYQSPMDFYLKNEFKILADNRLETDTISAVKITWRKS